MPRPRKPKEQTIPKTESTPLKSATSKESCSKNGAAIAVIIILIIVGGVIYAWQKSVIEVTKSNLESRIEGLKGRVSDVEKEKNETIKSLQEQSETEIVSLQTQLSRTEAEKEKLAATLKFCTDPPKTLESGRDVYPINEEKYGNLSFLGELFTADDCGLERLEKIFGVNKKNEYTLKPDIELNNVPTSEFVTVLTEVGFVPGETCKEIKEEECTHWTLKKSVPVQEILKLKPFSSEIKSCECLNCG